MQIDQTLIQDVVRQVLDRLGTAGVSGPVSGNGRSDRYGLFPDAAEAAPPGVESLRSEVFSGDYGLAVIEHAPFGVIAAVTPVTHSLPTLTCNAITMIAAGNTVVFNPHPSGKRIT